MQSAVAVEVITYEIMESTVFWDMAPCSPVLIHRNYCIRLQCRNVSQTRSKQEFTIKYLLERKLSYMHGLLQHRSAGVRFLLPNIHKAFPVVGINAVWSTDLEEIHSFSYFLPYKIVLH
jgi:hypothetical protein